MVEFVIPDKKPLNLTPATVRRLEENDPIYKFVDYYNEDGTVGTMTVEQYKAYEQEA